MMRLRIIFASMIILTCFFTASAQTKELHTRLTSCHMQAMAHANEILNNGEETPEALNNRYHDIRMAYKEAIIQRIELKKALLKTEEIKSYLKTIEMHHFKAYDHYIEMKSELAKQKCDITQVKKHVENFSLEMNNAEQAHQALQMVLDK